MASKGLTYDGEKYRWTKSFPDLQSFVTASVNIPTDLNVNTLSVNSPASVSIINIPDEPESIINDQPIVPNADLAIT